MLIMSYNFVREKQNKTQSVKGTQVLFQSHIKSMCYERC